jgi:Arc/MetJ-type ribon-helix-helix transcriptional regulator
MQIVTINIPKIYIQIMAKLIQQGLYKSRSDLLRVAIKDFLIKELELLDAMIDIKTLKIESCIPHPVENQAIKTKPPTIDMRTIKAGWPTQNKNGR